MGQITIDQSHQIMATLATNTNWAKIDFDACRLQDSIIRQIPKTSAHFEAFLKNGGRVGIMRAFQVWRTVELGTYRNASLLREAIRKGGGVGDNLANEMMEKPEFTTFRRRATAYVVNTSPIDLGFPEKTLFADVCDRAIELGLSLCPPEVGPQIWLQHSDKSDSESLQIAMDSIPCLQPNYRLRSGVFRIQTGLKQGLSTSKRQLFGVVKGFTDALVDPNERLLFVLNIS
jgi:hypothetical protein